MTRADDEFRHPLETERQCHRRLEGHGPVNQHPDGCWWCGHHGHMSDDCPSVTGRTADQAWMSYGGLMYD